MIGACATPSKKRQKKMDPMVVAKKEIPQYINYIQSTWVKRKTSQTVLDLIILLPSGVADNDCYSVQVDPNENELIIDVKWPSVMSNIDILLHALKEYYRDMDGNDDSHDLSLQEEHPVISGFSAHLRTLKSNVDDDVWKRFKINLPLKVEKSIKPKFMKGEVSGSCLLSVTLYGVRDTYANATRDTKIGIGQF